MVPDAAVVLAAVGLAVIHRRGVRASADGRSLPLHGWGLAAGLVVAVLAVAPVVEAAAERSFVWHMAQHQLLLLLAAPLIATAQPLRSTWAGITGRSWRVNRPGRMAGWTLPAGLLAVAVLLIWHVPAFYDLAMAAPAVHVVEHGTLLGSAVALWAAVVHAAQDRRRLGLAVVALAGTAIAGAALGVVLLTAPRPLYAAYASGGSIALEQQQVGGALMKVGGLLVHAGAAVAITLRWLHRLEDWSVPASR